MAKTGLPASIYKELVEGLSAYQSALNNGFVGTEVEWLASLEGAPGAPGTPGAGQVISVVPGAGISVDNSDPANPIVAATGGSGGGMTLFSLSAAGSWHSGAYSLVGNQVFAMEDIKILGAACQLSNGSGSTATYKFVIIRHVYATGIITDVWESEPYTLSGRDDFNTGKNINFKFTTPVQLVRDADTTHCYTMAIVRTDGAATDSTSVGYSTSTPSWQWQFFRFMQSVSWASKVPVVGANFGGSPASGHVTFTLFASF